jgi:hypothetical protein
MFHHRLRRLAGEHYVALIGTLCLLSLLLTSCFTLQRKMNPYLDRDISGPITISSEWVTLTPPEPMRPEREVNALMLNFAIPYMPDYRAYGLRFPDGSLVVPEV